MSVRNDAAADLLSRTANLPSATNFSACGWAFVTSDLGSVYQTLWDMEGGGFYQGLFYEGGTANVMVVEHTGASASFGSRPAINTWFFWAITCAGVAAGNLIGYWALAGDTAFTTASATGNALTPADINVGNDPSSERMDGRTQYVKCWDAVLTAGELMVEMHSAVPRRLANLNFFWPLWDATVVKDFGGLARDPTVGGTLTTEDGPPVRVNLSRRGRRYRSTPAGLFRDDQGLVLRRYRTLRSVN